MSGVQNKYEKGLKLVFENQFKKAKKVFIKIEKDEPFATFYIGFCDINPNIVTNANEYLLAKKNVIRLFKKKMKKFEQAFLVDSSTEKKN